MKKNLVCCGLLLTLFQTGSSEESRRLLLPAPHSNQLKLMVFSPDHRHLATADVHGQVKIWNWENRSVEMTLQPAKGDQCATEWMEWTGSDTLLVEGSDHVFRYYDTAQGSEMRRFELPDCSSPAVLPNKQLMVCCSREDSLTLDTYALTTGEKVRSFPVPQATSKDTWVKGLAASPDGQRVTVSLDPIQQGNDRLLELEAGTGQLLRSQEIIDGYAPEVLHYSPSGQKVVGSSWDIVVWSKESLKVVKPDRAGIQGVAWNGEDQLVYVISNDGATLHRLKGADLQPEPAKKVEKADFTAPVVVSPEGFPIVSTQDGKFFNADSGAALSRGTAISRISALTMHPKGRLITGLEEGNALVWDLTTGKLERRFQVPGIVRGLALSEDGSKLAVATNHDNDVRIFDYASGRLLHTIPTQCVQGAGWVIQFSPAGDYLVVLQSRPPGWEDQLQLYKVSNGEPAWKVEKTFRFAFHPREHKWAVLRREGLVEIDLRSGDETLHKIKYLKDVAYDAQGNLYALQCFGSGHGGNLLKLYPKSTGRLDEGLEVHHWNQTSPDQLVYNPREHNWWIHADSGALYQLDEAGKDLARLPDRVAGMSSVSWQVLPNGLLAVRSSDGTAEFWRAGQPAPEGQLVVLEGGQNWLCTSANGFFDGTDAAERLLEWQVGRQRYRVDQFFQQGYRPGLLREFFRGAKVSKAPGPLTTPLSPPLLEIVSPAPGTKIEARETEIQVRIRDQGDGFSPPKLFVNGHGLAASQTRSAAPDVYVFKTRLQPGINEIRATGFDRTGMVESRGDRVRLTCLAEARRQPILHVLAVGVNRASAGRPLQFAEGDAQAIAQKLKSDLYASVDLRLLCGAEASKAKVDAAFRTIESACEPQDTLVVFLAGHGLTDGTGYRFLLPGQDVEKDSLSSNELAGYLESISAQKQFVMLDTCHSAAASPDLVSRFAITQQRMARGSGTFLLAACRSGETAAEIPGLKHGLLTYSLLNGLSTKGAAANPEGQVTVNALVQFVSQDFAETSHRYTQNQELFQFGGGTDFPLTRRK